MRLFLSLVVLSLVCLASILLMRNNAMLSAPVRRMPAGSLSHPNEPAEAAHTPYSFRYIQGLCLGGLTEYGSIRICCSKTL